MGCGILPCVTDTTYTLTDIEHALRACWAADTCSPDDVERAGWSPGNPAWGHCDITALVVHDLLGGDLVVGEVHMDGEQHGFHWWNRLPGGTEIDLTRDQFRLGQTVTAGRTVARPAGRPPRRAEEYELLRGRFLARLAGAAGPDDMQRSGEPVPARARVEGRGA
ncbi:hypothetical protein OGH68_13055 [Streptomyces peucetius]|uniref:Uncharacterized protein n=1 Tax=Streptomyces peucetius TaxID=1950 RepID=A0ABY6IHY6_STRPE|nr:hypothetical protein OGH68_13055 [Streptomyces peucetius]